VARLRLGLRVVIGARKGKDVLWLQSLAHHAHQVLAQPVQVGLLAQPSGKILRPRRTGARGTKEGRAERATCTESARPGAFNDSPR
jgi:hypothetical protein